MTGEKGLTIIETMIAGFVLVVGAMGMATVISDVLTLTTQTDETTLAVQAAQSQLDRLWAQAADDFPTLYVRYNEDTSDDPDADSPGNRFDVTGLDKIDAEPNVGEILFFINEHDAAVELGLKNNEGDHDADGVYDPTDGAIDMDLNGEFNETDDKVTTPWSPNPPSHQILPVRIEIQWKEPMQGTTRTYVLESIIYPR
ncbi:MAG: hypothetical protein O7H41_16625 [Planctomycetota bacterium]|nr:hypothetical protein [Planctomycetota bacterium]